MEFDHSKYKGFIVKNALGLGEQLMSRQGLQANTMSNNSLSSLAWITQEIHLLKLYMGFHKCAKTKGDATYYMSTKPPNGWLKYNNAWNVT